MDNGHHHYYDVIYQTPIIEISNCILVNKYSVDEGGCDTDKDITYYAEDRF